MKSLKTIFLVGFSVFTMVLPEQVKSEPSLPPAPDIGSLMGYHLCNSLIKNGNFEAEGFGEDIIKKYGEETSGLLLDKINEVFAKNQVGDDQYTLEMFREVMNYIISNDACFKAFVAKTF